MVVPAKLTRGLRLCFTQKNAAGQRLECSHFQPAEVAEGHKPLPVVVYCHCNSGSRRDAEEAVLVLLPHHVSVFALDFAVRLRFLHESQ